jgi:hypothetical protein
MMAGLSPLMWMTGGVSGVDDAVAPISVEFAKLEGVPAGDGFARPADTDWLNSEVSWDLVTERLLQFGDALAERVRNMIRIVHDLTEGRGSNFFLFVDR